MTEPKNIRLVIGEIRSALENHSHEQLLEVLTHVFREFVVEGSAPLGSGVGAVLDAKSELNGLSFGQLMVWLQHHLDLPELSLFEVTGERVSVRIGGRATLLEAPKAEPPPPPTPVVVAPPAPVAPPPGAPPSIRPAAAVPAIAANAGVLPTVLGGSGPNTAPPAAAPAAPQNSNRSEDGDADSRFSRLEVD